MDTKLHYIKFLLKKLLICTNVIDQFDYVKNKNFLGGYLCNDFRLIKKLTEVIFEIKIDEEKIYIYYRDCDKNEYIDFITIKELYIYKF